MWFYRAKFVVFLLIIEIGLSYTFHEDLYQDYELGSNMVEEEGEQGGSIPTFTSPSLQLTATRGNTVRLPCTVDKIQGFVLVWKKEETIISIGSTIIMQDPGKYLVEEESNGSSLVIRDVDEKDQGEYICQVSAYRPTLLKHEVYIRTKPVLRTTPDKSVVVKEGEPVSLLCETVGGSLEPNLTWRRAHLQSHLVTKNPGEVMLSSSARSDTGDYVCEADNGPNNLPVNKTVHLEVQYGPEIVVDEVPLSAEDVMERVELMCTVDSNPPARVQWVHSLHSSQRVHKSTTVPYTQLKLSNNIVRYTVVVNPSSAGFFTCTAASTVGSVSRQIYIEVGKRDSTDLPKEIFLNNASLRKSRKVAPSSRGDELGFQGAAPGSGSRKHSLQYLLISGVMAVMINL